MMRDCDVIEWAQKLKLPNSSLELIKKIRTSEPSRAVGGGSRNVPGTYPSKKMCGLIQFESHKVELPGLYIKEHDNNVLEMYDQPPRIKLSYNSVRDKVVTIYHTPDFFVLYRDKAGWEEWKDEDELKRLSVSHPNRYASIDGCWRCPPGEAFAEQLGLHYWVKSSKEINWSLQRNLLFLQDYLLDEVNHVSKRTKEVVLQFVKNKPGALLSDILSLSNVDSDSVYYLFAQDELYVNLEKELLVEAERCHVFINNEIANIFHSIIHTNESTLQSQHTFKIRTGQTVLWDGNECKILNVGQENITINSNGCLIDVPKDKFLSLIENKCVLAIDDDGREDKICQILMGASHNDLAIATSRHDTIMPILDGAATSKDVSGADTSERTIRDWVRKYKSANEIYGNGFIGLIPNIKKRGNRNTRISDNMNNAVDLFISENETVVNQSISVLYGKFALQCEEKGIEAPSRKTFYKKIKSRPQVLRLHKTQGSRVAYQKEAFYYELDFTTPRHGDRPFEIAHIDHTQLDLIATHSQTGKILGKPWLSIMMDAFSRRVLAFFLTYDEPSYRSDMMLIRECVRRFSRLPEIIVTDNGCDFRSVYFQSLLACFGITQKFRPCHKARFGAIGERIFGVTMEQSIHNLMGNTKIMKNVRQVTSSVNPEKHAVWTLPLLYDLLKLFFEEVYDCREHSTLGPSPKEVFERGLLTSGTRPYRHIAYNKDFLILTLPCIKRNNGTALVNTQKGIKVNYFYYYCDEFQYADMAGKRVSVKFDPWDLGIVYSYIRDKWVVCYSQYYSILKNRSEHEIKIATEELLAQKKNNERNRNLSAKELAKFISDAEQTEAMLYQRTKDIEISKQLNILSIVNKPNDQEARNIITENAYSTSNEVNKNVVNVNHKIDYIFEDDFDFNR